MSRALSLAILMALPVSAHAEEDLYVKMDSIEAIKLILSYEECILNEAARRAQLSEPSIETEADLLAFVTKSAAACHKDRDIFVRRVFQDRKQPHPSQREWAELRALSEKTTIQGVFDKFLAKSRNRKI